jgi:hypothetical protein
MKTLFDGYLTQREFGRRGVSVSALVGWAKVNGASLPAAVPDLAEFDVVQLEALLCAFERGVRLAFKVDEIDAALEHARRSAPAGVPPRLPLAVRHQQRALCAAAKAVAPPSPLLALDGPEDHTLAAWLLGAAVASQWRDRLRAALALSELQAVDSLSGLPADADGAAKPDEDAALLRRFRELGGDVKNGNLAGTKGALAALAKEDGRNRNTLKPRIIRAAGEAGDTSKAFQLIVRSVNR